MTKVPRKAVDKISELSILVTGVRIIEDARIMDLTETHVTLRYRKPRSAKRWEQIFPLSQVLFIRDKGADVGGEEDGDGQENPGQKLPKRMCDAVVMDTFQLDEYADIASIDKLDGNKVFATTVEGFKIIADTSICRFVQDVNAGAKAATVTLGQAAAEALAQPARASANFN